MSDRVGFMQGRLSPLVDGRIQAFPWPSWRDEFAVAQQNGFRLMEWTLDQERLSENPLMTAAGQGEIRALCAKHGVQIPSLTGDCFMQAPFWKAADGERASRERDFHDVITACAAVGISTVVVPLVDNGRLENRSQEDVLVDFLLRQTSVLAKLKVRIAFESDYVPQELARFIDRLDRSVFGVNYDIGNSAALGYQPAEELAAYGPRVANVHVKDRAREGSTVSLGSGNADFDAVFAALSRLRYGGNYILQTARAEDGDHVGALRRYRDMTKGWLSRYDA